MLKKELESLLTNSLKELGFEIPDLILEYPKNSEHGDYASNVSFQLARQLKKAPPLIAQDIKEKLSTDDISNDLDFNPVSGFLNISLNPSFLMKSLSILEEDPHFSVDSSKIILEFVSSRIVTEKSVGGGGGNPYTGVTKIIIITNNGIKRNFIIYGLPAADHPCGIPCDMNKSSILSPDIFDSS